MNHSKDPCRFAVLALLCTPLWIGCAAQDSLDSALGGDATADETASAGEPAAGEARGGDSGGQGGAQIEPGQLTAGQWRDLDNWDDWLKLMEVEEWSGYADRWRFQTTERFAVQVQSGGIAQADVPVALVGADGTIWEARTDVGGRAELFSGVSGDAEQGPFSIQVNGVERATAAQATGQEPQLLTIPEPSAPAAVLDLMFMIDTTGSMGDELAYLQVELADVISEVQQRVGGVQVRLSVNFYRDEDDDYVLRPFPFTTDVDKALADLATQRSDGGGDYPEAVIEALDSAIDGHEWSPSARARLLFLVLDAPPHHDGQRERRINTRIKEAAAAGIRVIPIASSGVDKDTEFFLRFIDILTGGSYVFLTNHSGIGGDHIEPTIGEYEVEQLNALLVSLITASLGG